MKKTYKDYLFVGIQFFLFFMYVLPVSFRDFKLLYSIKFIGGIVSLFGGLVLLFALLQLNTNLSPFPSPKRSAFLVKTGMYKYVRHPIYSGIILLFIGYAVYKASVYKMIIALLLLGLFYLKSKYEESKLKLHYKEYSQYCNETARFFPKIF